MSVTVEKCLQAWTNSLRQLNAKADIVFLGDSLTYYGNFASVFPGKVVCNLGLRGDTIEGMIDRVEQVRILEPKQVFLMAGINDVAVCSSERFKDLFRQLICVVLEQNKNIELIIQSLLPVNDKDFIISCGNNQIRTCNVIIKDIAEYYKLYYLDLFSLFEQNGLLAKSDTLDGIHLKDAAYNKWMGMLLQNNVDNNLI